MKRIILTSILSFTPVAVLAQQPAPQPSAEEIAARAEIQIGQLQQAVGKLTLENIELKKQLEMAKKPEAPKK